MRKLYLGLSVIWGSAFAILALGAWADWLDSTFTKGVLFSAASVSLLVWPISMLSWPGKTTRIKIYLVVIAVGCIAVAWIYLTPEPTKPSTAERDYLSNEAAKESREALMERAFQEGLVLLGLVDEERGYLSDEAAEQNDEALIDQAFIEAVAILEAKGIGQPLPTKLSTAPSAEDREQ